MAIWNGKYYIISVIFEFGYFQNYDGKIEVTKNIPETNELTGSYHYYPFGMKMEDEDRKIDRKSI
ncbi:MAG: hypothetical protein H6572_12155 [Lewinellaceae bacterium]|nr:hypothetical protein [Lewinellaceae bacterium]